MLKIYHNNRCRKSREALQYLQDNDYEFEIIEYLKTPLKASEWKEVLALIDKKPSEVVRTQETLWKQEFKGKDLTESEILNQLAENPRLIERPIVIDGKSGTLGRPLENLITFLKEN